MSRLTSKIDVYFAQKQREEDERVEKLKNPPPFPTYDGPPGRGEWYELEQLVKTILALAILGCLTSIAVIVRFLYQHWK